jgi:hypothetical protein
MPLILKKNQISIFPCSVGGSFSFYVSVGGDLFLMGEHFTKHGELIAFSYFRL